MGPVTKLRANLNGKQPGSSKTYNIGVPAGIGRALESVGVTAFEIKMDEEGILLVPIKGNVAIPEQELPAWLQSHS